VTNFSAGDDEPSHSFFGYLTVMVRLLVVSLYVFYLQEEERQRKMELEMSGWTSTLAETEDVVQVPPAQQSDTTHQTAERDSNVDGNRF
jgi:hypothetical protein